MKLLHRRRAEVAQVVEDTAPAALKGAVPVADVRWREPARVAGRVRSMRVQPWAGVPTLELTLMDETAGVKVVFLGRRHVAGIHPGTCMVVEGMVGAHEGRIAILNPEYELLADAR